MKCANCGFISNRDFFRCPYCGHIHEEANEGIRTRINIGHDISMQVRTILIIISLNLFGVALLADWYFGFQYSLSLWAFILIFLPLTIVDIATSRRKSLIIALEKVDLFIVLTLMLACGLGRINGLFDVRPYMSTLVLPGFLLLETVVASIILFKRRNEKIRPLWTELLLIFHLIVATILFVFFLVNKYCTLNGVANPPFHYMQFGMTPDYKPPLYIVEEILIFAAFGGCLIYLINYNVILVGYVYRKVKNIYGGEGD